MPRRAFSSFVIRHRPCRQSRLSASIVTVFVPTTLPLTVTLTRYVPAGSVGPPKPPRPRPPCAAPGSAPAVRPARRSGRRAALRGSRALLTSASAASGLLRRLRRSLRRRRGRAIFTTCALLPGCRRRRRWVGRGRLGRRRGRRRLFRLARAAAEPASGDRIPLQRPPHAIEPRGLRAVNRSHHASGDVRDLDLDVAGVALQPVADLRAGLGALAAEVL